MNGLRRFLVGAPLLCAAGVGQAHKLSDSYLTLRLSDNTSMLAGQWDIALRDLDYAIGIDTNHDGEITWGNSSPQNSASGAMRLND